MPSAALTELYQQVILDHAQAPHGRIGGDLPDATGAGMCATSHQYNPTCGDEILLQARVRPGDDGQLVIEDVEWKGQGCSISQASASMMVDLVRGQTVAQAEEIAEDFRRLMESRGEGLPEDEEEALGDAAALGGVSQFVARIKCALLGWMALRDSLARSGAIAAAGTIHGPLGEVAIGSPAHGERQGEQR